MRRNQGEQNPDPPFLHTDISLIAERIKILRLQLTGPLRYDNHTITVSVLYIPALETSPDSLDNDPLQRLKRFVIALATIRFSVGNDPFQRWQWFSSHCNRCVRFQHIL